MSYNKWKVKCKRTYHAWYNAMDRCVNVFHPAYANYGGRGITFDSRWYDFDLFVQELGKCPVGYTLERVNNDFGYFKENCKWATYSEQNQNKRLFQNNTTGIKGIAPTRKGWQAYGRFQGKRQHLGTYQDFFLACCARKSWENLNSSSLGEAR